MFSFFHFWHTYCKYLGKLEIMREIEFRAQRVDNGEWVYGSYIENLIDSPCIIDYDANQFEIKKESISQFTGLKDNSGVEIYEGDNTNFGKVFFHYGCFCIKSEHGGYPVNLMDWNLEMIEVL